MPFCAAGNKSWDTGLKYPSQDDMIVTESGIKLKCQVKYLGRHRVTIGSCATIGNLLQMGFRPNHYTHVIIIDEAGQCTEPEIMVAVAQISKEHGQVIIAGDPHHLQAVVINEYARGRGLPLSFLERILSRAPYLRNIGRFPFSGFFGPRVVVRLLYNYRTLSSRLNLSNELSLPMISEGNSREAK
ncbi:hypothetical protein GQX74_014707, partial [Glossina fuscipes]